MPSSRATARSDSPAEPASASCPRAIALICSVRSAGAWRTVPVNLLTVDGVSYLVAPRGVTQWVRNLRAAGSGELRVGRRVQAFRGEELPDGDKTAVIRAYLTT